MISGMEPWSSYVAIRDIAYRSMWQERAKAVCQPQLRALHGTSGAKKYRQGTSQTDYRRRMSVYPSTIQP